MGLKIEVDHVTSRIIGEIEPVTRASLYFALSYAEPGAYFAKQNNRFAKDRKYLITDKRQEFRTGLLQRVCEHFDTAGTEYEIIDKRKAGPIDHFMPLKTESSMRGYQQDAIDESIRAYSGMVRVATGGGKTRIMAGICAALERKAVILVHRLDLLHQVLGVLNDLLLYPEIIGRVGGGIYEPNVITVCTVQTICAALGITVTKGEDDDDENPVGAKAYAKQIATMLAEAQVVVVDEAHHAPAKTISEVMKRCTRAIWRLGMSATDWRDDGADLLIEAAIGPRIFDVSLSDLIEMGWLVAPTITMRPQAYDDLIFSDNWNTLYKHYYTENNAFNSQVVDTNLSFMEQGRHILTLVTAVNHGRKLEALHRNAGVPSIFLSGKDTTVKRREVMDDIRSGRLRHLIGTSIADEGLDMPILDALTLAGGGRSTTKVYQRIGRVLRPFAGKTDALVADFRLKQEEKINKHAGRRANVYRKELHFNFKEEKS